MIKPVGFKLEEMEEEDSMAFLTHSLNAMAFSDKKELNTTQAQRRFSDLPDFAQGEATPCANRQ